MTFLFHIRRLICWVRGTPLPLRTEVVNEVPDEPVDRVVYLYRTGGDPWGLGFLCPCGCGELIELNLMPEVKPRWRIEQRWDSVPSIHPSVWRKVGCRSHFWLREGEIKWVHSDGWDY